MKSQKTYLIGCYPLFLVVLLTTLQVEVWAQGQKKQWVVFHDQIPESSTRYSVTLKYVPSEATFCSASRSNIESVVLPEGEQIDDYKERIDFGTAVDGYQYSVLLRGAGELHLLNRNGRQIRKVRILRSKQDVEPEIVQEGYLFINNPFKIPFELPGQQLPLPTTESIPGTFSINIYGHNQYSHRGSFSSVLKGSLAGSALIEGANLEVSVSYKQSLRPNDRYVKLTVQPFDEKLPSDSTSGKITDILKLRSAKLVVEKIASDSSKIVLATVHGNLKRAPKLNEKSYLSTSKPVPAFARVDLIGRQLLTLDDLCKKAGSKGYVVLIFGDLKRTYSGYRNPNQQTNELTLDETIVMETLQRDLKTPPTVVFVCRRLSFSDLYEKWLGKDPGFYIFTDYSNPMNIQFWLPSYNRPSYPRPSAKAETLREQLMLPENKVSVLLVNGKGSLVYIDFDAGKQLAEVLTEINTLMRDGKRPKK